MEGLHGLFSGMERAEWLLLVNVECKLLAKGCGFTMAISQALFPEGFVPNPLHFNQPCHSPRRGAFVAVQNSGWGKSHQIGNEKRASRQRLIS